MYTQKCHKLLFTYILIYTYVVFPDPLGPIMAFIPGLITALKLYRNKFNFS